MYSHNPETNRVFQGNQHTSVTNIGKVGDKVDKVGGMLGNVGDAAEIVVAIKQKDEKALASKFSTMILSKGGETAGLAIAGKCTKFAVKKWDPKRVAIAGTACYIAFNYGGKYAGAALGTTIGETSPVVEVAKSVIKAIDIMDAQDKAAEEKRKAIETKKDPMLEWHVISTNWLQGLYMKLKFLTVFILLGFNPLALTACAKPTAESIIVSQNAEEIYQNGEKYYLGKGVSQNYQKAFQLIEQAANMGLADAQNDLASMYFDELGTKQDYEKAFFWFSKSAQQNFPEAQYNLGLMYANGNSVPVSKTKALELYTKAAEQNFPQAQFNLANAYLNGDGLPRDESKALELYTRAAEQNFPQAQFNLANAYFNGDRLPKDEKKAVELYTKAAEQNFPQAQFNLAYIYEHNFNDREKAKYWFKKASDNGIEEAGEALMQLDD